MIIRNKQLLILGLIVLLPAVCVEGGSDTESQKGRPFVGQDLYLAGGKLISYQINPVEHAMVFQSGFSMSIGADKFSSDSAVVWLESVATEYHGQVSIDIKARMYLRGKVSAKKIAGAKTTDLSQTVLEEGQKVVVRLSVSGEVFVTADKREISDPRGLELYKEAFAAVVPVKPRFVVREEALVPEWPPRPVPTEKLVAAKPGKVKEKKPLVSAEAAAEMQVKEPRFRYPVNLAPAGEVPLKVEKSTAPDGTDVATVIGRVYVWQKQDEKGRLLELQADSAVIFYSQHGLEVGKEGAESEGILAKGAVKAIYMSGDVVITEGQRTIRADEVYYDFQNKKALAVNAVMRNFDVSREIPIYVRAAKLRQLAENKFAAENVVLTSSEFHRPQVSLTAADIIITDTTTVDQQEGKLSDSSYDVQMRDVRAKAGETTVFRWPYMRSDLQRPDIPLKSMRAGNDNAMGTWVETDWYLARLLGLREPKGTDSTFSLDYYGYRGVGVGAEIEYERENCFGSVLGYLIDDRGEDKLGRHDSRRNLPPDAKLRGWFRLQHRHFLPYNWQLTTEVGYSSDENFIESYYRQKFYVDKEQETLVHLKRIEDNWAISILGKVRINDFADELEELPSVEYHLTGQSFFNDVFTLYSDSQVSRLRQRIGDKHSTVIDQRMYSFVSHRTEVDMPVRLNTFKLVPFVAGTFGYDDRSGFTRTLVNGDHTGSFGDDKVWIGEAGVRLGTQYWKVYPDIKSRLWDLNQLRHIIKPQITTVFYKESDSVVEQRDTINVGISQRLQTRRGPIGKQRIVDWMRLDMDFTWVNNSDEAEGTGPDRFIWNQPIVPLRVLSAPDIFNGDLSSGMGLQRFERFGPRRNYFGADYIWYLSDTTAVLSDINYDMQSSVVQQYNIGISRLCWPNLQFYIGSRYLRRVTVLGEKGSNAFTFAATYAIDPRYTLIFAQQFDFDYGANIQSDIAIIRRYHRMYYGITYSADESLDRQAIVFSIWPEGVPEMAFGSRRYAR